MALVSPLHALGSALFSAHMVQHLVLILVAAPLLALSRAELVCLVALPRSWRAGLVRLCRPAPTRRLLALLGAPAVVVGLHAAALWAWHLPALYLAAVESEAVHLLEHVSFLATAVLLWRLVIHGAGARAAAGTGPSCGTAVAALFITLSQSGLLAMLMTFATAPWYPAYGMGAAAWGLTAIEDQHLAGLIMWVPAGLVYVLAAVALVTAWLTRAARPRPHPTQHRSIVPPGTGTPAGATARSGGALYAEEVRP